MRILALIAVLPGALVGLCAGAEVPKEPVPKSPSIAVVYRYADAMIEHGRDTFGPQKTGLLLSALDRSTLAPLTSRPAPPAGVREIDRAGTKEGALSGANPQHDENLLRLLLTLSELSSKPIYRQAAEAELKWFLENSASPAKPLLPWDGFMSWEVLDDSSIAPSGAERGTQWFSRPWMLWDECFKQAPEASRQLALGLWEHQTALLGKTDGVVEGSGVVTQDWMDSPRQAGYRIRTWAVAYAHTKDQQFLKAISVVLDRHERGRVSASNAKVRVTSTLSLVIDCAGAAHRVSEPLASRLRAFCAREDALFCSLPHDLTSARGFVTDDDSVTVNGVPRGGHTPLWTARSGGPTTAQVAMMCVSRYDNTGHTGYRELIHAAADAYLGSMPPAEEDLWPGTLGHAISLQLAAWRSTARPEFLGRARQFGDMAIERFFDKGPLPRASLKSDHYESITGADTLALALTELHLHVLHITAVRCPPNTIDR